MNAFDIADEESGNLEDRVNLSENNDDEKPNYTSNIVKEEDDEEIDSDEAMGSADDEDLPLSKIAKDDDSDNESVASFDERELLPLSAIWDMDDKKGDIELNDEDESDESGVEEEEESEDESEQEISELDDFNGLSDEDGVDEEQLAKLRKMIAQGSDDKQDKVLKKRLESTILPENEFSLPSSGEKITMSDLTGGLEKDSLTLLKDKKGRDFTPKPLPVPLPKRIQQRHDRKAAYELTCQEVTKWEDTVKKIRESEHLQFPINSAPPVQRKTTAALLEPSTELEKKVQDVLIKSSLADEKTLSTFEELAPSKLSIEEVKKRRNELRLMRDLMLREEQKAKRIKRIKSKSYRKVHKKERERLRQLVEGDEENEQGHDMERAKERMNLKHKNSGKWAKRMVEQGLTKDVETRAEMEEMLRRGDSLRQKILGRGTDNDSDEEDEDGDDQSEPTDEVKASLGKGLLGMKFMRDAEQREKKINQKALEGIDNFDIEDEDEAVISGAKVLVNEGRRVFAPGAKEVEEETENAMARARQEQEEEEDEYSPTGRVKRKFTEKETIEIVRVATQEKRDEPAVNEEEADGSNPWLAANGQAHKDKSSVSIVGQDSNRSLKAQEKIRKQKQKLSGDKNDQDVLIDMNQTLDIVDQYGDDDGNTVVFKQQDLVKRAFAGDDVVDEFQQEKRQKIREEGDQEIDISLPGWGSWAGNGVKKRTKLVKKVKGVDANKRKDAKVNNVIITEKINKKTGRYTASAVPFPFENRQQYEQSLLMPIGQEWSTRDTHQKLTKPKVLVQQGLVIDPIKAPFK